MKKNGHIVCKFLHKMYAIFGHTRMQSGYVNVCKKK